MKILNYLFPALIFLSSIQPLSAQKNSWTIGVYSGIRSEVLQGSKDYRKYVFGNRLSTPPIKINVSYCIDSNFYVTSGLAYTETKPKWDFFAIDWNGGEKYREKTHLLYRSIQIPMQLRYDLPIYKNDLFLFIKAGLNLDIPIYSGQSKRFVPDKEIEFTYINDDYTLSYKPQPHYSGNKINFLINTGIGIAYQLPCKIRFALTGEYYTGTRNMTDINIPYTLTNKTTGVVLKYNERLLYRGDYWMVGLGISYTFKIKEKEEKEEEIK